MPAVASPSVVLTRNRLKNVLAKSDIMKTQSVTDIGSDTDRDIRVDTRQVEFLLSVKKRKHGLFLNHSQTSSCESDTNDETTDDQEHEIVEKLQFYMWIQCENPECLKWRRLPKSEAAAISEDTPWFCFMNSDLEHNSCEDIEDNYRIFEKQARQCHLKCVASTLPIGSLVWAKMGGYCRWPGIISCDPKCGEYVEHDEDPEIPEPTYYHVEFLGLRHSHSWVLAQSVELYGLVAEIKKQKMASTKSKKDRASYHGCSVEAAISEANQLLDCLAHKRLEICVFNYYEKDEDGSQGSICDVHDNPSTDITSNVDLTKCCQNKDRDRKKNLEQREMQTLMNRQQKAQSLIGHSKEEKYILDVQMYEHNQSAFQHDVCRFMLRNHCCIRKLPLWHGTHITLFQLFLAVHERGGYQQVCHHRDWTAVYNELTSDHKSGCGGTVAKRYYRRNLLPYEMYISGLDYQDTLAQCRRKSPLQQNRRRSSTQDTGDQIDLGQRCDGQATGSSGDVSHHVTVPHEMISVGLNDFMGTEYNAKDRLVPYHHVKDDETEFDKAKGILEQIDSITAQCDFSYLDSAEHAEWHHTSLVTFYDESPDEKLNDYRLADTAFEFGLPDSPSEDAAEVLLDLSSLVSCGGDEEAEDLSVGLNVEEMLRDVAAMQREIDELEDNMSES